MPDHYLKGTQNCVHSGFHGAWRPQPWAALPAALTPSPQTVVPTQFGRCFFICFSGVPGSPTSGGSQLPCKYFFLFSVKNTEMLVPHGPEGSCPVLWLQGQALSLLPSQDPCFSLRPSAHLPSDLWTASPSWPLTPKHPTESSQAAAKPSP